MLTLTPHMLRIPAVWADRYARQETNEFEELVAAGNLALVEAAASYNPAHGTAPETWLFQQTLYSILKELGRSRRRSTRRWRQAVGLSGALTDSLVARREPARFEVREAVRVALRPLPPLAKTVFLLHAVRDWTFEAIGRHLAVGREQARLAHWQALELLGLPLPRRPRGRNRTARLAVAGRYLYVARPGQRTLVGPAKAVGPLLARLGLPGGHYRGAAGLARARGLLRQQGWQLVKGPQVRAWLDQGFHIELAPPQTPESA